MPEGSPCVQLVLPFTMISAFAAETPASYRTVIGKTLVEEHFDAATLPTAWPAPKGTWTVVDGALECRENPEDEHNSVFLSKKPCQARWC